MRRTTLLLAAMTLTVLVVGGVAFALTFTCDTALDADPASGQCKGTPEGDFVTGTSGSDFINTRGGDDGVNGLDGQDTIHGRGGVDGLDGGPNSDNLFGEGSHDVLAGRGGVNLYFGASGPDRIIADNLAEQGGANGEEINGGPGNDTVFAADGLVDLIDCGRGTEDTVSNDTGDDVAPNCEIHD